MTTADRAGQATVDADEAARDSAIEIRNLDDPATIHEAVDVLAEVWGEPIVYPSMARAIAHGGGYVTGAYGREGSMIGASVAFLARHHGRSALHSHATALLADHQRHGRGRALKLHQRAWSLDRGIDLVTWTFDPLVTRNTYFNLEKLGARGVTYMPDFYGPMTTAIEQGQDTDRCLVEWDVASDRVAAAVAGTRPEAGRAAAPDHESSSLDDEGSPVVIAPDADEEPVVSDVDATSERVLARVPLDAEELRGSDPARATRWRNAFRESVGALLAGDHELTAATRTGTYVLTRD